MAIGAVIGLGYVGLPLLVHMAESGHTVVGIDVNKDKVEAILAGNFALERDYGRRAAKLIKDGRVLVTTDFDGLTKADFISVCVPTPLDSMKTPDLTFVQAATHEIARRLRPGQAVVLESTTYPGTTSDLVRPILEQSGLKVGVDFFLGFSPDNLQHPACSSYLKVELEPAAQEPRQFRGAEQLSPPRGEAYYY